MFGVYDHNEGADQDEYVDWFEHNDTGIAPRKWQCVSDVGMLFRVQVGRLD